MARRRRDERAVGRDDVSFEHSVSGEAVHGRRRREVAAHQVAAGEADSDAGVGDEAVAKAVRGERWGGRQHARAEFDGGAAVCATAVVEQRLKGV